MRLPFLLLLFFGVHLAVAQSKFTLSGTIADAETGKYLPNI